MTTAEHIRRYAITHYIAPARAAGQEVVRIRLGDVRWSYFVGQEGGRNKVYSGAVDHAARVLFNMSCCSG